MTDKDEETLAFMARQLLEMNQSLRTMSANFGLVKGWMDGQEAVTRRLNDNLADLIAKLEGRARTESAYRGRVDALGDIVRDMGQTLKGIAELSKSTFDIVLELKTQRHIPGGDNEQAAPQAQAL